MARMLHAGGVFLLPNQVVLHALVVASKTGALVPDKGVFEAQLVEFFDGTPLKSHTVTAGRLRVLSTAFAEGCSKILRLCNIIAGETQLFGNTNIILQTQQQVDCLVALMGPSTRDARDLAIGKLVSMERLWELGMLDLFQKGVTYNGVTLKFSQSAARLYVLDNKSANNISGVSLPHCSGCDLSYGRLPYQVMGGNARTLEKINYEFNRIVSELSELLAFLQAAPAPKAKLWAAQLTSEKSVRFMTLRICHKQ
jgi:hypothetical protein